MGQYYWRARQLVSPLSQARAPLPDLTQPLYTWAWGAHIWGGREIPSWTLWLGGLWGAALLPDLGFFPHQRDWRLGLAGPRNLQVWIFPD